MAGWFTKIQYNPLVLNKRALDYRCFVMNTRSLSPEVSTYYPLAFVAELRQKVPPPPQFLLLARPAEREEDKKYNAELSFFQMVSLLSFC